MMERTLDLRKRHIAELATWAPVNPWLREHVENLWPERHPDLGFLSWIPQDGLADTTLEVTHLRWGLGPPMGHKWGMAWLYLTVHALANGGSYPISWGSNWASSPIVLEIRDHQARAYAPRIHELLGTPVPAWITEVIPNEDRTDDYQPR